MYIDKLDRDRRRLLDRFAREWSGEQRRLQREIDRHEPGEHSSMDDGVQIPELARNAQRLFKGQEPRNKRRLLNLLLSNCSLENGEVSVTFRQPFDLLIPHPSSLARGGRRGQFDEKGGTRIEPKLNASLAARAMPSVTFHTELRA
jgi:site-specific DNA recombinase